VTIGQRPIPMGLTTREEEYSGQQVGGAMAAQIGISALHQQQK